MTLSIRNQQRSVRINTSLIRRRIHRLMTYLGCDQQELSIVFANNRFMQTLNRTYRQKDHPTNVLAFPQCPSENNEPGPQLLGDIVVSVPTAAQEANTLDQAVEDRLFYLIIHGLLHLLGYDHEGSANKRSQMEARELEILKQFNQAIPSPLMQENSSPPTQQFYIQAGNDE